MQFDRTGLPVAAWGYDAQNVGYLYEVEHSYNPGVYVNRKNYRGPLLQFSFHFYQTDTPNNSKTTIAPGSGSPSLTSGTDAVIDGRTFHRIFSERIMLHIANRQTSVRQTAYTADGSAINDDCELFYKSAESTKSDPTALLVHMTSDASGSSSGDRREEERWNGTSPVTLKCGSYLPAISVNTGFFQDIHDTYVGRDDAIFNWYRNRYSEAGANLDLNPLSIYPVTHGKRMSFGLHPLGNHNPGWLGDGWSPHAQGIIDNGLVSGCFGGLLGVLGGPLAGVLGFFGTFDAVVMGAMIQDVDNGIDPQTGNPFTSDFPAPATEDFTSVDLIALADWDGDSNSSNNSDGSGDPSGGANDGYGDFNEGDEGGSGCERDGSCST